MEVELVMFMLHESWEKVLSTARVTIMDASMKPLRNMALADSFCGVPVQDLQYQYSVVLNF